VRFYPRVVNYVLNGSIPAIANYIQSIDAGFLSIFALLESRFRKIFSVLPFPTGNEINGNWIEGFEVRQGSLNAIFGYREFS